MEPQFVRADAEAMSSRFDRNIGAGANTSLPRLASCLSFPPRRDGPSALGAPAVAPLEGPCWSTVRAHLTVGDGRKGLCVMATMKKRAIAAITAGVWFAAIGSAAALTYGLNRPLQAVSGASQHTQGAPEAAATQTEAPSLPVTAPASPVQMMPTFTVVGYV